MLDRPRGAGREQVPASVRARVLAVSQESPPAGTGLSHWSSREKTQIQALDRTQPLLPMTFGATEKRTHDYVRHDQPVRCAERRHRAGAR